MDIVTAVLLAFVLLVVLVIGLRFVNAWATVAEETVAIKRANAERMAQLDGRNPKKNGSAPKKPKKNEEDDDEELEDPLVHVLDHPVVRGLANRYGVDVDLVLDGDEREIAKVDALLARAPGGLAAGANANAGQLPPPL